MKISGLFVHKQRKNKHFWEVDGYVFLSMLGLLLHQRWSGSASNGNESRRTVNVKNYASRLIEEGAKCWAALKVKRRACGL